MFLFYVLISGKGNDDVPLIVFFSFPFFITQFHFFYYDFFFLKKSQNGVIFTHLMETTNRLIDV